MNTLATRMPFKRCEVCNWLIEKLFSLIPTTSKKRKISVMVKMHQNCTYATSEYTVHLDIDECVSGNNSCHDYANCTNTIGSYTCECKEGFTGNGVECEGRRKNCTLIFLDTLCICGFLIGEFQFELQLSASAMHE